MGIGSALPWNVNLTNGSKFKAPEPNTGGAPSKSIVDVRWVLTWKMVEDKKAVEARLVGKGYQEPDSKTGIVGASGCVILRSSHFQVLSLRARKSKVLSFRKLACAGRTGSGGSHRVWKLPTPVCS